MNNTKSKAKKSIRGVNKLIIELPSPEHDLFERAILFIKPQLRGISSETFYENANDFLQNLGTSKAITYSAASDRTYPQKQKHPRTIALIATISGAFILGVLTGVFILPLF